MKITEFLHRDAVIGTLASDDKAGVMKELCQVIARRTPGASAERLLAAMMDREARSSTGLGDGVAIPHGKLPGLPGLVGAFAISRRGVDFNSIDGKPAFLFFALLAPDTAAGLHLKALARISRLFKSPTFRQAIHDAPDGDRIYELITTEDEKA